jgi:8-oxo-dGTP diphosphatase
VHELPPVHYSVRERPKIVRYWLMNVVSDPGFTPNDEVDELRWLSAADAGALLTYDRDKEVLEAAAD